MPKTRDAERPWERQPGETEKAYEAFVAYRDLGAQRSVSAVSEKLSKSRQLISRWKAAYSWDERVLEYDNELQREAKRTASAELRKMNARQVKIAMQLQEARAQGARPAEPERYGPEGYYRLHQGSNRY